MNDEKTISTKSKKRRKNERKDGLIQKQITIGYTADHKRIRKYFYGHSMDDVNQQIDVYRATAAIEQSKSGLTVREWAKEWLAIYKAGVSYNTRRTYQERLDANILPMLGDMIIDDVKPKDIQQMLNAHMHLAPSTMRKVIVTTRQLFDMARKNGLIATNPAIDANATGKGKTAPHRALEASEQALLTQHWDCCIAGLWAMLMLYAGLRRGEMIALRWRDVDINNATLHVSSGAHFEKGRPVTGATKTAAGIRDIPIPQPLLEALQTVMPVEVSPDAFVCLSASGQPLTKTAMRRGWESLHLRLEQAANGKPPIGVAGRRPSAKPDDWITIKPYTPHDMRHTYATTLYDAGVDVKSAQRFLGHATIQMTMQLYTHLSTEREQEGRDKLLAHFAAATATTTATDQKKQIRTTVIGTIVRVK